MKKILCIIIGFVNMAHAQDTLDAQFKNLIDAFPYIEPEDIIYERNLPRAIDGTYKNAINDLKLLAGKTSVEAVKKNLNDNNPYIRTIALLLLFEKQDIEYFPYFKSFLNDTTITFDKYVTYSKGGYEKIKIEKNRINNIALQLVAAYIPNLRIYTSLEEYNFPLDSFHYKKILRECDIFWEKYGGKNKKYCSQYYILQLERITKKIMYCIQDKSRLPLTTQLKDEIKQSHTPIDADLLQLWLDSKMDSAIVGPQAKTLLSHDERIQIFKNLGIDNLFHLLRDSFPTQSIYLECIPNDYNHIRLERFILKYIPALYKDIDINFLLFEYNRHKKVTLSLPPEWYYAVSIYKPDSADYFFMDGMNAAKIELEDHFANRAKIAAYMWEVLESKKLEYLINEFYTEDSITKETNLNRATFIELIKNTKNRLIIKAIIEHDKFKIIDAEALRKLIVVINSWITTPLVSNDDLYHGEIRHPYDYFGTTLYWDKDKLLKEYPKEGKKYLNGLDNWRSLVKKSIQEWTN